MRYLSDTSEIEPAPGLLDWKTVHKKMAWDVIIILGGGFAMATACQVTTRLLVAAYIGT